MAIDWIIIGDELQSGRRVDQHFESGATAGRAASLTGREARSGAHHRHRQRTFAGDDIKEAAHEKRTKTPTTVTVGDEP
jgi:hypothetical protein